MVNVTTSQRGIAQPVIIYSNKNPKKKNLGLGGLGAGAVLMAQSGQLNDEESKKPEIIFVYAPNVPNNYHYCISEFIAFHFGPKQIVCLDLLMRGNYVQNFDELEMPQLRKLYTSNICEKKDDEEEKKYQTKMEFVDNIKYLETGNLLTSLSASILQQCEYNGNINGYLFVSISDLDYLSETLISFANVLKDFIPQQLKGINVVKKCAKYANKRGHLLTGRDMFV